MMACERSTPRLPLLSLLPPMSPERSGTLTPPLHTSAAAVPFRWEQEPGKPRPCTDLVPFSNPSHFLPKSLELPPCRLLLPSPTTVLDGPYAGGGGSFRNMSSTADCYGSFGAERGLLGAMILSRGREVVKDRGGNLSAPTSFSHAKSRVWTKICEGLKQAVPWRSKKLKREGSGLRV